MGAVIKLLAAIIILVLVSCFAGFNIQNTTSLWPLTGAESKVPVFIVVIVSFCAGILFSLAMILLSKASRKMKDMKIKKIEKKRLNPRPSDNVNNINGKTGSKQKKNVFSGFGKKNRTAADGEKKAASDLNSVKEAAADNAEKIAVPEKKENE